MARIHRAKPIGCHGFGLAARVHSVPFQCTMTVRKAGVRKLGSFSPTAHAFDADSAVMPKRSKKGLGPAGYRIGTVRHFLPFQCSARRRSWALPWKSPTAHASLAASTPLPGFGLGTTCQEEPFQCSAKVWAGALSAGSVLMTPTAQTLPGELAL